MTAHARFHAIIACSMTMDVMVCMCMHGLMAYVRVDMCVWVYVCACPLFSAKLVVDLCYQERFRFNPRPGIPNKFLSPPAGPIWLCAGQRVVRETFVEWFPRLDPFVTSSAHDVNILHGTPWQWPKELIASRSELLFPWSLMFFFFSAFFIQMDDAIHYISLVLLHAIYREAINQQEQCTNKND